MNFSVRIWREEWFACHCLKQTILSKLHVSKYCWPGWTTCAVAEKTVGSLLPIYLGFMNPTFWLDKWSAGLNINQFEGQMLHNSDYNVLTFRKIKHLILCFLLSAFYCCNTWGQWVQADSCAPNSTHCQCPQGWIFYHWCQAQSPSTNVSYRPLVCASET